MKKSWVALALAAALPVLFCAAVAAAVLLDRQKTLLEADLLSTARAVAVAVDVELDGHVTVLRRLAEAPELDRGDLTLFHEHARRLLAGHPDWFLVILQTPDGARQLVNTAEPAGAPLPTPFDRDGIVETARSAAPVIGPLALRGRTIQEPFLVVRVPVLRDGVVRYVLSTAVKPAALAGIAARQRLPEQAFLSLYDRDFVTVARSRGEGMIGGKPSATLLAQAPNAGQGIFRANTREGVPVYGVLEHAPRSGFWIAVGIPEPLFEAPLRSSIGILAIFGGVACLLSVTLTLTIGGGIARRAREAEERRSAEVQAALGDYARLQEQARCEAQRVSAAKSRFLAAVSHDLRQPFQALRLFHAVLAGRSLDATTANVVERLGMALQSGEQVLNELLDVSAFEEGTVPVRVESFSGRALIEELVAETRPVALQRGLDLRFRCDGDCLVRSDRALLRRMLRNLLSNALKYTATGGILLTCRCRGDHVLLQVWDTGPGIPAEHRDFIFEDFYQIGNQARDRREGLGLGLPLVLRTARLLGHPVRMRSRPGRGTVFTVRVPQGQRERVTAAAQ